MRGAVCLLRTIGFYPVIAKFRCTATTQKKHSKKETMEQNAIAED